MDTFPQGRFFKSDILTKMTSYAQNCEDVTLRRALRDIESGFFVDIGANHPTDGSVTRWFYDQGWSGINIEPNPAFLKVLKLERPRDTNIGVAVGSEYRRTALHIIGETGLTTIMAGEAELHKAAGIPTTSIIEVDVVPLDGVLDAYAKGRTVDFLKIDAEGAEIQIIKGAAFVQHRPRIVLIETNGFHEFHPLMLSHGYHFIWFDALNVFYVREEDAWRSDLIARPPSIWDNYIPYKLLSERDALRSENDSLRASTSWRITSPLRKVRRFW